MRTTMIGAGLAACVILALQFSTPAHGEPVLERKVLLGKSNPCAGAYDSDLLQVKDQAELYVRDGASANVALVRDSLGLSIWPVDSVVATTDSLLCTHLDSLVTVWLASPAAATISRESWWTSSAVARVNPGVYWVRSTPSPSYEYYNFVVDSTSGVVKFLITVSI